MKVNSNLHKTTYFMLPVLDSKIEAQQKKIDSILIDCSKRDWDSYDSEPMSEETVSTATEALLVIQNWFRNNIGFLNNRTIEFDVVPLSDSAIHISFIYFDVFEADFYVKGKQNIEAFFYLKPIPYFDGKKVLADNEYEFIFSNDLLNQKFKSPKKIKAFLNEAFYKYKWSTNSAYSLDIQS